LPLAKINILQSFVNLEDQLTPPKPEGLKIETSEGAHGVRIIKLSGPFTLQTLSEFQQMSRQDAAKPVVLDLTGVSYLDSAALGSILGMFASCQKTKRGFALTGLTERVRSLFKMTHVDGLLPCFDSLEAAESAVTKS
jgi:anti-anti-sigma factor